MVACLGLDHVEERITRCHAVVVSVYRRRERIGGHAPAQVYAGTRRQAGAVHHHRIACGDVPRHPDDARCCIARHNARRRGYVRERCVGKERQAVGRFAGSRLAELVRPVFDGAVSPHVVRCVVRHLLVVHEIGLGGLVIQRSVAVIGEDAETVRFGPVLQVIQRQHAAPAGLRLEAAVHVDVEAYGAGVRVHRLVRRINGSLAGREQRDDNQTNNTTDSFHFSRHSN